MNTPARPNILIAAEHLGPIFSLKGELTRNAQNLVFARNGTGKSFLSRALRYLDLDGQGVSVEDAPGSLVSDESPQGRGTFSIDRGTEWLGQLELQKNGNYTEAKVQGAVFHVFSEDFVQEELRENRYTLNGEIKNQIAVDSKNIELVDAQRAVAEASSAAEKGFSSLQRDFEAEKISLLSQKAGVRRQLGEYGALRFETLSAKHMDKPIAPSPNFADILRDLDRLKSIPSDPLYPHRVDLVSVDDLDVEELADCLNRLTTLSTVSVKLKRKIEEHREFYKTGIEIIEGQELTACPFCEQSILSLDPKAVIDSYIAYFNDEEARHKSELRGFYASLNKKDNELQSCLRSLERQKSLFDKLKGFLPSTKDHMLAEFQASIDTSSEKIARIKAALEEKARDLSVSVLLPEPDLLHSLRSVNIVVDANNTSAEALNRAIARSDDERKELHRRACVIFGLEFINSRWADLAKVRELQKDRLDKADILAALERASPSADARVRVAATFEVLLREFFGGKYLFDKQSFTLTRGQHPMLRGPHRTLSDGEKTAIAFCYFIASIHKKVKASRDYGKLFLVFDDPVTSMSYDYVFAIAQVLKNLNISNQGEVSINPGLIDGGNYKRPELLILTHSSYFFNICVANRVVHENSAFSLFPDKGLHRLAPLKKYIAPFREQLKDIQDVVDGKDPDHATANSIRSVLEAIGRFCQPDKSDSLTEFVQHIASEEKINIKSVLINSLCHGTYYDEMPSPDDLKLACSETIEVVRRYASGQLEVIKTPKA